jgi:hypothetical protein
MKSATLETLVELCGRRITEEIWLDDTECTKRLTDEFARIAAKYGYTIRSLGHGGEFLALDMVLFEHERMIAAIEIENDPRTDPIEDEWKKLAHVDADRKILISYCTDENLRNRWAKRASEILSLNPRNKEPSLYFLVLGNQDSHSFYGYEFDETGRIVEQSGS